MRCLRSATKLACRSSKGAEHGRTITQGSPTCGERRAQRAGISQLPIAEQHRHGRVCACAHIARSVPALRLDLPANALGKDFLGGWQMIAPMPSGTGWQISLFGLAGAGLAREEGIEFNLLGLSAGFDFNDLALRLPGYGSVPLRRG